MKEFVFGFEKFGTKINFSIVSFESSEEKVQEIFHKAEGIYERYNQIFNRFNSDSEISKLNQEIGSFNEVSDEVREVVEKSVLYNKETGGYFDPRIADFLEQAGYDADFSKISKIGKEEAGDLSVNGIKIPLEEDLRIKKEKVFFGRRMEFSGIVKGLVNDKVVKLFSEKCFENFVVDSGGDMFFSGKDAEGKKWTVDVEGVSFEKLILEISDKAIATSGIAKRKWEKDGKRKHHLIDPKNPNDFKFDLKT
ncbi:MAG: hypothetical protein ACD_15C00128G0001, partial [uncultured bacterium]